MKRTSRRLLNVTLSLAGTTAMLANERLSRPLLRAGRGLHRRSRALLRRTPPGDERRRDRFQQRVARLANGLDSRVDRWKQQLGGRLGDEDAICIAPYRGYGSRERLYLKGRVLEDQHISEASVDDSLWRNLVNTYKRFESDEIAGATVRATFQGQSQEVSSDEEGFFELWMEPQEPLPTDRLWHEIALELVAPCREPDAPTRTTGFVLVPPPAARFGIISDVDDTVVHTNATSLLKMGRTVFLGNARTRLPFEGVAAFYQALQAGASGHEFNPLFYVSSSPWNLYDLVDEFLEIQKIPVGPLMLRDWGLSNEEVLPTKHAPHKKKAIRQILESFPDLPFILIGDSGQEDPEIYFEIVRQFPERILAIYIRNVSRKPERPEAIITLAQEVAEAGSTLVLADDTLAAAHHAVERGWISAAALPHIRAEKEADEPAPSAVEQLLGTAPHHEASATVIIEGTQDASGNTIATSELRPPE